MKGHLGVLIVREAWFKCLQLAKTNTIFKKTFFFFFSLELVLRESKPNSLVAGGQEQILPNISCQ
jgi:hypothetical protein